MKKKNILIILSVILLICIGIGAYQIFTPKKIETKNEPTISATEEITESTTENPSEKDNSETTEKPTSNAQGESTSKAKSQGKQAQPPANTSSSQSSTATTTTTTTQSQNITVKVSITCNNIDKSDILSSSNVTLSKGDSVFDATKKICGSKGIGITYQSVYYIQGFGGIMEKDYGASSGWMYRVNGVSPNKSACNYALNDNDIIEWYYVTSPADR